MKEKILIPSGGRHFEMIDRCIEITSRKHSENISLSNEKFELLGTSLSMLYETATCHRECKGGDHIFERLCAKSYNICCSAYNLMKSGFYDEALSLIRGIGELTNLVALYFVEPDKFQGWLKADSKTRKKEFSPVRVRMLLEPHQDKGLFIIDKIWYGNLSEDFCHIKPDAQPNNHNESKSIAGGLFQQKGVDRVVSELFNVVVPLVMMVMKIMGFDDEFKKVKYALKAMKSV